MVKVTFDRWGMGLVVGGFAADLFIGDVYVKVPGIGELAWNRTGFYVDPERSPKVA